MWWKSFTQFTNSRYRMNKTCLMIREGRSENWSGDSSPSPSHLSVCLLAVTTSLRTTEGTEPVCVRQYAIDFARETLLLSHYLNPSARERASETNWNCRYHDWRFVAVSGREGADSQTCAETHTQMLTCVNWILRVGASHFLCVCSGLLFLSPTCSE